MEPNAMSNEVEVRQASAQFYAALNRMLNGDAGPLADIWSHDATVTTMHPIGGRQVGWAHVRDAWEQVARVATGGLVTLEEQILHVSGDLAYETGVERGSVAIGGHKVPSIEKLQPGA
jgi:ketosteroid isomerase-like protein